MKKSNFEAVKRNQSSTQVLKTLLKLLQDDYTMAELIEELNKDEDEPVFNNSVISKYINTCRFCGIDIPKLHNRYVIAKLPFGMDISDREYKLIQLLQDTAKESLSALSNNEFNKFITKLGRYSNKQIIRIEENAMEEVDEAFINAAIDMYKIRLIFKTNIDMICCPIKIIEKNDKKYLCVKCGNKEKTVSQDRLAGIEVLKEKFYPSEPCTEIVFKLKGGLAMRYEPRENEVIINDHRPEYITISNKCTNIPEFLSRISRYDSLCFIERPQSVKDEMKKIIADTLANYGE